MKIVEGANENRAQRLFYLFLTCRIVVDGWLELVVPEAQVGQKLIAAAQQLRSTWNRLLELRLQRGLDWRESRHRESELLVFSGGLEGRCRAVSCNASRFWTGKNAGSQTERISRQPDFVFVSSSRCGRA